MTGQEKRWLYLGESLSHVIQGEELVTMLATELPAYQRLVEAEEGMEVDEWWAEVANVTLGGERQFPILSRFTLLTRTQPLSPYQVCPEPLYFSWLQP